MKKWKASKNRLAVRSRGTNNKAGRIVILEQNLRDSNKVEVLDTARGVGMKIYGIKRDEAGLPLGEREYLIDKTDFIGEILTDGKLIVAEGWIHVRKCKDPEEEIVTSLSGNKSTFAEIISGGAKTDCRNYVGWFVSVKSTATELQQLEETEHDWLVKESEVGFICKEKT